MSSTSDPVDFPAVFAQQAPPPDGYSIRLFEAHIREMSAELDRMLAARDFRAVFQLTYLTFSQQVLAALKAGRFEDQAWATDMCCRFVEAYLEQLDRWSTGDRAQCGAWRVAFGSAAAGSVNALQAMLLGMNAHINYDLAFVTLGACRHANDLATTRHELADRTLSGSVGGVPVERYRDFLVVNQIGWESIPLIQDRVLSTFSPVLHVGNRATRRITRFFGERVLIEARDASWCHTCLLIHAGDGACAGAVRDMIDAHATSITHLVGMLTLRPDRLLKSARRWSRRRDDLRTGTVADLLRLARARPAVAHLVLRQLAFAGAHPVPAIRELLDRDEPHMAAGLAVAVSRHAPAARRDELASFLEAGSPQALATLEALLEIGVEPGSGPAWSVLRMMHAPWARLVEEGEACLQVDVVRSNELLRATLTSYVEEARARAEASAVGTGRHRSERREPPDAITREEARGILGRHPDRWVRVCAEAALPGRTDEPEPENTGGTMALLIERVLFLKETALFMEVEPAILVHVAEDLEPRSFPAGEPIVRAGDDLGGIFLIRSGDVEVSQTRSAGEVRVATLGPGDAIGELSVLCDTPATADCTAVDVVEAFYLSGPALSALLHRHPRLSIGLLRLLSRRLIATTRRLGGDPGAPGAVSDE